MKFDHMDFRFEEIRFDDAALTYLKAGTGPAVVVLRGEPAGPVTQACAALAASRTVYLPVLPSSNPVARSGAIVARLMERVVQERCDLMGQSHAADTAAWLAAERPELVGRMILQSPPVVRVDAKFEERLGRIKADVLVLAGTRDAAAKSAMLARLVGLMAHAKLTYIYDAGAQMEIDQPQRVARIVKAFLDRGPAHIVRQTSSAVT